MAKFCMIFMNLAFSYVMMIETVEFMSSRKEVVTFNKETVYSSEQIKSFSQDFVNDPTIYKIDDATGIGRRFDGIGGLSGGGATSRLLVNYPEPYRSHILDYLFKPNFGASLDILKVEIGGDAQSTEGTEHSHMHTINDENYYRGYEWWLMKEAKLRNPNIKLVGLPWGWPGWIGVGTSSPYANKALTATYVTKWVEGAYIHHDLTIDYVGSWNERPYDVEYLKILRKTLDMAGFSHVTIVAPDSNFGISKFILNDTELARAVGVLGAHYPGTLSSKLAVKTGKQLWASEDYSTYNNDIGAGCWARILNQNYVNGKMTATISWNLVASYYDQLPFKRCALMTANEPWSGHYDLPPTLWITAHTTQFTGAGWHYLQSVGHLKYNGSYVSFSDGKGNLTIVIETMTHDQSLCIRPRLPAYTVQEQNATFILGENFRGKINKLRYWHTQLGPKSTSDQVFVDKGYIEIDESGQFSLFLPKDVVITLSTINTAKKGSYPLPPPSAFFPLPYTENFEPNGFSEAFNFADQSGAFENFYNASSTDGHHWTLRQVVPQAPVRWCSDPDLAVTLIGDYAWSLVNASVSVKIEGSKGAFIAIRVDRGGCQIKYARGLFLWLMKTGAWALSTDLLGENVLATSSSVNDVPSGWNTLALVMKSDGSIYAYINGYPILGGLQPSNDVIPSNGWVAIGTRDFGLAQFDDFNVKLVDA